MGLLVPGVLSVAQQATPAAQADGEGLTGPSLLRDPSLVPVTPSRDYKEPKALAPMPPDGSMTVDRRCRAEIDPSGWTLLVFLEQPDRSPEPSRWALPCDLLEGLEALIAKQKNLVFRVSGENTIYREQSFILLTKVTVEMPDTAVAPRPEPARPAPRPATGPATRPATAPAGKPATAPATVATTSPATKPSASSDDVFSALLKDKPVRPVTPPVRPAVKVEDAPSIAPKPVAQAEPTEKELEGGQRRLVADRVVRLLPAGVGRWQEVRFISDNTLQEPPLRMIPCAMLDRMETKARGGSQKFQVSGTVVRYKGREYLLLRKAIQVRDLGSF